MVSRIHTLSFSTKPGDAISGFRAFWRRALASLLLAPVCLLALAIGTARAEPRNWRSTDGSKAFSADYLSHDQRRVTVRRRDGRVITFDIAKLHSEDQAWLAARPLEADNRQVDPEAADPSAVFGNLHLGDLHADVRKKLDESEIVELAVARTFLGRFGLNGTYRTCQAVGGQHCLLFFDWTDHEASPRMRELSLQTEPRDGAQYGSRLKATWQELGDLLTKLHGMPLQKAEFPKISDLSTDGMFLASHLWRLDNGHSALLGSARDLGKYSVVVRFTTDTIEPVKVAKKPARTTSSDTAPPRIFMP